MLCTHYALNPHKNPAGVTIITRFLQIGKLRHGRLNAQLVGVCQDLDPGPLPLTIASCPGLHAVPGSRAKAGPTFRIAGSPAGPETVTLPFGKVLTSAEWIICENVNRGDKHRPNYLAQLARLALWQDPQPPGGPAGSAATVPLRTAPPVRQGGARRGRHGACPRAPQTHQACMQKRLGRPCRHVHTSMLTHTCTLTHHARAHTCTHTWVHTNPPFHTAHALTHAHTHVQPRMIL